MGPGASGWPAVDRSTRLWWRAVGRRVDHVAWLDAPVGTRGGGNAWLDSLRQAGSMVDSATPAGILPDLAALDGPEFSADHVDSDVRNFYQETAAWRMDVWIGWSALFAPFGALLARYFGQRVQQLAIPVSPLASSTGMDSRVLSILDENGRHALSAWVRTLRSSGQNLYSGSYSTTKMPGSVQPMVHVTFPLELGNIQVFLRPSIGPDGALHLDSPRGAFGEPGAYVVVHERAGRFAARLPIREHFRVYPFNNRDLRTDHRLQLGNAQVVRLFYRMRRDD